MLTNCLLKSEKCYLKFSASYKIYFFLATVIFQSPSTSVMWQDYLALKRVMVELCLLHGLSSVSIVPTEYGPVAPRLTA